jgi:VanZ family protein
MLSHLPLARDPLTTPTPLRPVAPARLALFALAYAGFVVYGSLLPFDLRPLDGGAAWLRFREMPYLQLGVASRADWVANILLYIPLAFALTGAVAGHARSAAARLLGALLAVLPCIALAFAVEFAQLFFPPRTVSQNDLIAETIGTLIGAAAWLAGGERLLALWHRFRSGGAHAWRAVLALYVLAYAALSFFPYDLLVSSREVAAKLANPGLSAFVVAGACGGAVGCAVKLGVEVAIAAPLGALLGLAFPRLRAGSAFALGLAVGAVIEAGQIVLASGVSQGVSVLTRALGFAWGLALQRAWRADALVRHRDAVRTALWVAIPLYLALLALLNGFTGRLESAWVAADKLAATRWLPFYYHYFTSETEAMWSLLANAGAYAVVGLFAWLAWPDRRRGWQAGVAAAALALAVEVLKLFMPGKKPDPTNVLIGLAAAWALNAVLVHLQRSAVSVATPAVARRRAVGWGRRGVALAGGATLAVLTLAGLLIASPHTEAPVDESKLPQLPPGEALPPVSLPGFRQAHPRLPHPSAADVARLRAEGQDYLDEMRRRAARGDLYARTVMEFIEPGSQDLAAMHAQLVSIAYSWRGHDQVRPVALAYDWLHARWSDEQRRTLRAQLAEGCEYLVKVIRSERLSPYNVYLYNAPFQALVACAIALWGDDPRGEPVMRFTHDLWKERVLPVWRQVMGRHGGWHEGGEYVGIGIGGAVYQVPAMWRAATGEDLFATEPGLRGFLDFVLHRTRPDGTHMRLGDGSYFDRPVPDALPLAIEYRHAAAYTRHAPRQVAPTAWPWGPLPDATLLDPQALARLPLARLFDGIGVVTARSDWSDQATYVTFKAGDNHWSHSHLDQGSFTIYKGGALALDSGANYGLRYGSDHHLNYSYQTIAHNAITVTDPDDTVPMPAAPRETPRAIANDGGQRRIGSGWGVEAAPLDLAEWRDKRAIYETGRIVRYADDDGITLAVADVTAAYTNELSGKGTFSHRTRRVERAWRSFAYDRVDDVVVVYDDVVATKPQFRKRWLLHTTLEPRVDGQRFVAEVVPGRGAGRQGGRLDGHVLLPRAATLLAIGGRGLEFMVDGRNYDEDGKLADAVYKPQAHRTEPGRWRLEVMPSTDAVADQFLVVMLPGAFGEAPPHRVRLVEDGDRVGAEVAGPTRTVRYWFRPGELAARIEVMSPPR